MAILFSKRLIMGVGAAPIQQLLLDTDNTLAEVLVDGYLTANAPDSGLQFSNKQIANVYTTDTGMGVYKVVVVNGIASLEAISEPGTVVGATVIGNLPKFSTVFGTMVDSGISPSDATKTKMVMASAATTIGLVAQFNDITGTVGNGPVAANKLLTSAITTPDVSLNLVRFDTALSTTALASSGTQVVFASSGSKQYKVVALWLNFGANLAVGNRNVTISDGTTTYTIIPSASLLTLVNATWGAVAIPFPTAAALTTSTAAGASLSAVYSGGTTDYTGGATFTVSGILQRVA